MLLKVANDDMMSFRNNNQWLNNHPSEALIFKDIDKVWPELKPIYNEDFKNLVYGNLPDEKLIYNTLKLIKERIAGIPWTLKNEK